MASTSTEKSRLILWVAANSAGWVLGIVVVVMLGEVAESIHIGDAVYLGLGMGWTVGAAQWLAGRKWFGATSRWMWASTIGMTVPFLFADLALMQNGGLSKYVLPALAGVGGFLSGLLQRNSLRSHFEKADRWVVVSAVAWMCPALLVSFVAVRGHPNTALEMARNLGSSLLGGVVLGATTGGALARLLHVREGSVSK